MAKITGELINAASGLIDELFTTKEERATAMIAIMEMEQRGMIAQMGVNTAEAGNMNLFVAGWRPAVGWTCVSAFSLTYVLLPILHSVVIYYSAFTGENVDLSGLPNINMGEMMPVLLGMLGLGGLRTVEKALGTAR